MTLISKIYLAIGFILLVFCAVTIGYLNQTWKVKNDVQDVLDTSAIIKEGLSNQKIIIDMETSVRGYLLTGDITFLTPYNEGKVEFARSIKVLDSLTSQSSQLNTFTKFVSSDLEEWVQTFALPLITHKTLAKQSVAYQKQYDSLFSRTVQVGAGKKIIDRARDRFDQIERLDVSTRKRQLAEMHQSLNRTNEIAIGLTVLAIIAGSITAALLGKNIRRRFRKMINLANSIATGDYSVSVKDKHHDEITELTNSLNIMAAKLQTNFDHLTKMNKELDQFAYVVSHDLKAPLRAIFNLSEWVEEDIKNPKPEVVKNLTLLRGRAQRMENLINGILEYSKIGRKNYAQAPIHVQEVLQEAVENLSPPLGFTVEFPSKPLVIHGEKTLFYQVISNLLSNALKYHHLKKGRIQVEIDEKPEHYLFKVTDDGPGIPAAFQEKIFGIFQTMESRDVKESTGVGLAIVKKIIEEKGEKIWIESDGKTGSSFLFTWPKTNATQIS